jgi:serine/threonine-protein phosphatase 2A activator
MKKYEEWKLRHENIAGKRVFVSPIIQDIIHMLDSIDEITDTVAPLPATSNHRFGNKAFKDWIAKLQTKLKPEPKNLLVETLLIRHPQLTSAAIELGPYLEEAFGNGIRIDYGSGHELSFIAFLTILHHCNLFTKYDLPAIALVVMNRYIQICRRIQTYYNLEPAGSHGVWGLDDYQFVPYIWGSGQLVGQEAYKPRATTTAEQIENLKSEYMWFGCIDYINQVGVFSLEG